MREVKYTKIVEVVESMTKACGELTPSCRCALHRARDEENNPMAKFALDVLIENSKIAKDNGMPVCQDTGMAVFFVKLGQDVHVDGGLLVDALNEGVRRGYAKNGYRASVLDPISRINTKDNTPCVAHIDLVAGDKIEISFLPKGFGSENMSRLYMLTPSKGIDGVIDCIVDAVKLAGSNPCPPVLVGVGIGGTCEKAMTVAKEQLLRDIGSPNSDETLDKIEKIALDRINALGIGAQGFGGNTTAYAVHIGKYPTHISALPVAVNVQCNAVRASKAVI